MCFMLLGKIGLSFIVFVLIFGVFKVREFVKFVKVVC